jgi:transposase InsO family protein
VSKAVEGTVRKACFGVMQGVEPPGRLKKGCFGNTYQHFIHFLLSKLAWLLRFLYHYRIKSKINPKQTTK